MEVLLESKRLRLRGFAAWDADHLFELDSDQEVMRYLTGGAPTPRAVIERTILPRFLGYDEAQPAFGFWAVVRKESGEFLGWISFRPAAESSDEAEPGYRLRRSAWGQGYATEACRAVIRKGFAELGMRRVVATTYEANLASRRVLEKVEMRTVRRFRLTLADLGASDTYCAAPSELFEGEDVEYAQERHEWEEREAGTDAASPAGPDGSGRIGTLCSSNNPAGPKGPAYTWKRPGYPRSGSWASGWRTVPGPFRGLHMNRQVLQGLPEGGGPPDCRMGLRFVWLACEMDVTTGPGS